MRSKQKVVALSTEEEVVCHLQYRYSEKKKESPMDGGGKGDKDGNSLNGERELKIFPTLHF